MHLDGIYNPTWDPALKTIGLSIKWILRGWMLFNFTMATWVLYYNTPFLTLKVLITWLYDFIKVAKDTYLDFVARFLDYLIELFNNGVKNIPKHPKKPVNFDGPSILDDYIKAFQPLKDLAPKPDLPKIESRWYDLFRDEQLSVHKINYWEAAKSTMFYVAIGLTTAGVIGLGYYYWIPIKGGAIYVFGGIKTSLLYIGGGIKAGALAVYNYITNWRGGGGGGGGPVTPTHSINSGEELAQMGVNPDNGGITPGGGTEYSPVPSPRALTDEQISEEFHRILSHPSLNSPTHNPSIVSSQDTPIGSPNVPSLSDESLAPEGMPSPGFEQSSPSIKAHFDSMPETQEQTWGNSPKLTFTKPTPPKDLLGVEVDNSLGLSGTDNPTIQNSATTSSSVNLTSTTGGNKTPSPKTSILNMFGGNSPKIANQQLGGTYTPQVGASMGEGSGIKPNVFQGNQLTSEGLVQSGVVAKPNLLDSNVAAAAESTLPKAS